MTSYENVYVAAIVIFFLIFFTLHLPLLNSPFSFFTIPHQPTPPHPSARLLYVCIISSFSPLSAAI